MNLIVDKDENLVLFKNKLNKFFELEEEEIYLSKIFDEISKNEKENEIFSTVSKEKE
jgi:hypothetical protein